MGGCQCSERARRCAGLLPSRGNDGALSGSNSTWRSQAKKDRITRRIPITTVADRDDEVRH
jgi:hypothetical protein